MSFLLGVDEFEEDEFEHEEEEDLGAADDPEDHEGPLLQRLEVVPQVDHHEGDRVDHPVDHQQPVQPARRNYAQQEHHDETPETVPVQADQLSPSSSTSGSETVSHFRKRRAA